VVLLDCWIKHLQSAPNACDSLARLGALLARMATLRAMSIALTARLAVGESPLVEAALVKDLGTELEQDIPLAIAEALGEAPGMQINDELLRTLAFVSQINPAYSLRGGTREILRGMIARGLGLR
jgi:hypothetical protein